MNFPGMPWPPKRKAVYRGRTGWLRYVKETTSLAVYWRRVLRDGSVSAHVYKTWWMHWQKWAVSEVERPSKDSAA